MTQSLPELTSYAEYLDHYARVQPEADAVWCDGVMLSYAQLHSRVETMAGQLYAAGLSEGQRIAVLSTPRTEYLISLLAAMKLGAVWLGLNPRYTERELVHVVGDSKPSVILSLPSIDGEELGELIERVATQLNVERVFSLTGQDEAGVLATLPAPAPFTQVRPESMSPATVVYTSGTSGAPKGAVLSHKGLVYASRVEAELFGTLRPRVPCNLPINHVACLADLTGTTLVAGGMLALFERFDPAEMLASIESLGITNLMNVPTVLHMIAMLPDFETRDLSQLKHVVWGGAAMPVESMRKYRDRGIELMSVYGMTETVASISITRKGASEEELAHTVGQLDGGMRVRLADESDEPVARGEEGEVQVQHEGLFLEYFGQPEATKASYTDDGWFRTGDVGVLRGDGNLVLVGRRSDMFKSGGYNIYPREIEQVIESFQGVALAAVIARADEKFGEVGVAYVTAQPGHSIDRDALETHCRGQLANYKVPKQFTIVRDLPLLPVGKVDKQALKRMARETQPESQAVTLNGE